MEVKRNQWQAWIYLAPTIFLLAVFTVYPLINTFIMAFKTDYSYIFNTWKPMGFQNFINVFKNQKIIQYFKNTVIITVISVPASVLLALVISVGLNSIKKFSKIYQTIFFMPYVTNSIAIGMVFSVMFSTQYGIVNTILSGLGLEPVNWLGGTLESGKTVTYWTQMAVLLIYIVWNALPFKILILLSGLQGIDKQYYQAAQIDCATRFTIFRRITMPLLSPQITFLTTTSIIGSFKEYSSIIGIFGDTEGATGRKGDMRTVVGYIYSTISEDRVGLGAAAAILLFILIMIFTGIKSLTDRRRIHY